jgi:alkaline phosphatase D
METAMRMILATVALGVLTACATATAPMAPPAADALGADGLTAVQRAMLTDFPQAPVTPPLPSGPLQKIVFGSCSNEDTFDRPLSVFDKMAAQKADLNILMGDNVYGSQAPDDPLLSDLRSAYWAMARRRPFTNLVSSTPTLAIWDDHDFGVNDGGGETFKQRALAQAMFDRFWRVAADSPQAHPNGVYGAYSIGPAGQRVQIILLDTRYWRSPLKATDQRDAPGKERWVADSDPARTMLGAAQWEWLAAELKKPAELRLIVSSVQVVAEGHGWEKWGNFPLEKKKLYDTIRSTGAKGVVILSGDRHYAQITREPAASGVGYPLYDFTASAINMPWTVQGPGEAVPQRISIPYYQVNYGAMEIDWAAKRLRMVLRDKDDKDVFEQVVPFAEIGAG